MKSFIPLVALLSLALASPAPLPQDDSCPPCEYVCIQSYPEGCYCANENEQRCAAENSCYVAKINDCPPIESPTPLVKKQTEYQSCGSRGQAACPAGSTCAEFPDATCGFACDEPGYCRTDVQCGGFAGISCPRDDQVCLDDPTQCPVGSVCNDAFGFCFPA